MKFHVVAVGHRMPAWICAGFDDYAKRMPREARLVLREIKPENRGKGLAGEQSIARMLAAEHRRILAALPANCRRVVLDERGRNFSTRQLADNIARWQQDARDVAFIIGSADGTAAALQKEADMLWSLSPLTLPHGLVRVVLAEQLYRAVSILHNHPYHRD
jgi:23S rRNA (pseudouridine1915-N3)-methyltransferase